MTLFRVVVNPTYADLQWFRFLVKKRQNSSTFYFFRCKNTRNHRRLTICTSLDYRRETILEKNGKKIPPFIF
jgi:hypothetical protein